MQGRDVLQQGGKALLANLVRPPAFELRDDVSRRVHLRYSAVGGPDECSSPVAWIAVATEVSEALEIVDERGHRLRRDAGRAGQLCQPHAVLLEVLEDLGVSGSEVVEAALHQALEHRGGEGLVGQAQRDAGVPRSEADGQIT